MSGMLDSFGLKWHFDEHLLNCVPIAAYQYSLRLKVHVSAYFTSMVIPGQHAVKISYMQFSTCTKVKCES